VTMMSANNTTRHRDEGFTLSEVLVVIALLGVVLSAAWMFVYAVEASQKDIDREAMLARSVTQPLMAMERLIVQNSAISPSLNGGPTAYRVTVYTDQDSNRQLEEHTFEAIQSANGDGFVNLTTYLVDSMYNHVGAARQNSHIAYNNANIRDNIRLFRYYDANGVELDPAAGGVTKQARSIVVELRITYAGHSETHTDTITFRNR
jgi:prepilin-type N-terminal cleavage/methylation domain-containing protein